METRNKSHLTTLNELIREEVMRQIPLMIYLIILCLSGIAGNCLVCYIFTKKYSPSTFRTFVIILAAVDLFTSSVVIPLELVQFAWQYTYDNVLVCKLNLFVKMCTTITSGFLFLCIAIDRYRKVCRPFGIQVSPRAARYMCVGSAAMGVAFSWTSIVMYSVQTAELTVYNLTISECAVTKSMKRTIYPLISNVSLAILFVGALIGIIIMYSCIAVRIKKQTKKTIGDVKEDGNVKKATEIDNKSRRKAKRKKNDNERFDCEPSTSQSGTYSTDHCKETNLDKSETDGIEKYKSVTKTKTRRRSTQNRTTMIMFMISLAFIMSYLPFLCITLIRFADKTFAASLTDSERAVYKFVYRSYFLNCAVNPVIYGVCDIRFRKACKMIFACKQK